MSYRLLVPALLLETLGIWLLASGKASWSVVIILHSAAALLPAFGGVMEKKAGRSPCPLALIAVLTMTMPGVGLYGSSLALLMSGTVLQSKGLAHEPEQDSSSTALKHSGTDSDQKIFLEQEIGVEPIIDILREDDSAMKRGAIQLLQKLRTAESVMLLRKSLSDPDSEIRFYAHTALTRMEEYFSETISSITKSSHGTTWKQVQTARLLMEYVQTGLPEGAMRRESLLRARELMESALLKSDNKHLLYLDLAELCLELKDRNSAAAYLKQSDQKEATRLLALQSRLMYENRNFPGLAELYPSEKATQDPSTTFWNLRPSKGSDHA
jgi:hypothetical protein